MGIAKQLQSIETGFKIVASFPEWRHTAIVLGESDPEGCAACSAKNNPQNSYRNGPLYASYTAEALSRTMALATREHVNLLGSVTWAFEFEDQPPFEGFRELATNGIDKPVLNAFRAFGLLSNERVQANSSAALSTEDVVASGVRAQPDVNVIATRKDHEVELLVWNFHDDDVPAAASPIELTVSGLPENSKRVLIEQFQIDSNHSNAFTAWKNMGSPQSLFSSQRDELERAGQLQQVTSPAWSSVKVGTVSVRFALDRQALRFIRITW